MDEAEFACLLRDREIIAFALHVLADTGADPTMTRRANELASRFRPNTLDEFRRASKVLAAHALYDGENCTSIVAEFEDLARRVLEYDAEAVEGLAPRSTNGSGEEDEEE